MCINSLENIFSFISHIRDKTKYTMKDYKYETNSKKNPVWNKWQPQLLCANMWAGTYKKMLLPASDVSGALST